MEVNVSQEATKQGIFVEEVMAFIEALASFDKIRVVGLMTMAPLTASKDEQHQIFKELKGFNNRSLTCILHMPLLRNEYGNE